MKLPVLLALALAGASAALAVDPYIAYIYPAGIQAGATNRFVVGGQYLGGQLAGAVSGGGVTVLSAEVVPGFSPPGTSGQRQHLKKWLDAIAKGVREEPPLPKDPHITEWRECSWWRKLGELDALQLSLVERDLFIPKNALQMSPSLRQKVILTVYAEPDAQPGLRDLVLYNPSAASAPHPIYVTAAPHVEEPLYVPPHRQTGKQSPMRIEAKPPFIIDGQIMPGETDRYSFLFAKGERLRFTLVARELLPYIGDAVPGFFNAILRLVGPNGEEVAFADDNSFRPDPILEAEIPASGDYVLEVRDNLFRGREDFVYMVEVERLECEKAERLECEKAERREGEKAEVAPSVSPFIYADEFVAGGVVKNPGGCEYEFEVPGPCTRVIEVVARTLGSPLDPVVSLYSVPSGWWPFSGESLLQTWDDKTNAVFIGSIAQSECDPVGSYSFTKAGRYKIRVDDRVQSFGDDYFYTLSVREPSPDFTVYCNRSSFPVRDGVRTKAAIKVVRHDGFDGAVKLVDTPELRFEKGRIPAESNEVSMVAVGLSKRPGFHDADIFAEGTVGGRTLRRRVVPCDEVQQAFAWAHLLPAEAFRFAYALWKPTPPREQGWPGIPDKLYADIRRGTNAVADVSCSASSAEVAEAVSRRRLRGRRLVRAGAASLPSRRRMNELLLAGVTEFDAPGDIPFQNEYALRLMGVAQNAVPDNDVLVYAPTTSVASAHAEQQRLLNDGWCADLLPEDRLDALNNWAMAYRVIFVPSALGITSNQMDRLVAKVGDLGWQLVFEDRLPFGIEGDFKKRGPSRVMQLPKRGRVLVGPRGDALTRAAARREPFTPYQCLRCSRWKDGPETVYFVVNVGKVKVERKLKPSARTTLAFAMDPATGAIAPAKVERGSVSISLAPGAALWLRVYPWELPKSAAK